MTGITLLLLYPLPSYIVIYHHVGDRVIINLYRMMYCECSLLLSLL
ncbi:hypothetical protein VP424E501_P0160 [Vibrio phage 424E50-1]|nr:hypothetical protein VP424E501_P0160 [Vibrio phage 424E50-1]